VIPLILALLAKDVIVHIFQKKLSYTLPEKSLVINMRLYTPERATTDMAQDSGKKRGRL